MSSFSALKGLRLLYTGHLVVEEVLGQIQCQGKQAEQILAQLYQGTAGKKGSTDLSDRHAHPRSLIFEKCFLEAWQVRPDVLSTHRPIIPGEGVFPSHVEALVEIAPVLGIRVLTEECRVPLKIRRFVYI